MYQLKSATYQYYSMSRKTYHIRITLLLTATMITFGCSKSKEYRQDLPTLSSPLPIAEWNENNQYSLDVDAPDIVDIIILDNEDTWALDYASRRLLKITPNLDIIDTFDRYRYSIMGGPWSHRAPGRILLLEYGDREFLVYDKSTNLFHIAGSEYSDPRTIPAPSMLFSVAVDNNRKIHGIGARFPDYSPHSGKLIITINSNGIIENSFGTVIDNRRNMFGINFGFIVAYNDKLWTAFYRLPLIRVYNLVTGELEKELILKFPQFERYSPVLELVEGVFSDAEKSRINVEYAMDRMPVIIEDLVVFKDGIFIETGNSICKIAEDGSLSPVFIAPTGFTFSSFAVLDSVAFVLNDVSGSLMSIPQLKGQR